MSKELENCDEITFFILQSFYYNFIFSASFLWDIDQHSESPCVFWSANAPSLFLCLPAYGHLCLSCAHLHAFALLLPMRFYSTWTSVHGFLISDWVPSLSLECQPCMHSFPASTLSVTPAGCLSSSFQPIGVQWCCTFLAIKLARICSRPIFSGSNILLALGLVSSLLFQSFLSFQNWQQRVFYNQE